MIASGVRGYRHRMVSRIVAGLAVVVLSATAGAAATAQPATTTGHHAVVYIAHLRLQVDSTAASTTISFTPGAFTTSRLTNTDGPGTWRVGNASLTEQGGTLATRSSVTADLLYENPTSEPTVRIGVQKAAGGSTRVTVANVIGKKATAVQSITDDPPSTANPTSAEISRSKLMGRHAPRLPRADPRKLVLAFYYPWYRRYTSPRLSDHPRDPRSTYTRHGVDSMTAQAKSHGVDGFIVSWAGNQLDGKQFRLALRAAHHQHQLVTGYLESAIAASHSGGAQYALHWLAGLLHYSHHHAFLKSRSGVPVVFVYQMTQFTPSQWQYIRRQLRDRYHERVHLVGDALSAAYSPLEWGVHSYGAIGAVPQLRQYWLGASLAARGSSPLRPHVRPQLFAAAVSPGYADGQNNTPRSAARYVQTWRAAAPSQPDWTLVTTWNEWFEGTEVEPGRASGSATLKLTKHESAQWKRRPR